MATRVDMPQMGESVVEGTILTWLKKEGETVEVDEPIVEVSTDKVDTEIPSPVSGKLVKIMAQEGDTIEVGAAICEIDESGEASAQEPKKDEEPKEEKEEPKKEEEPKKDEEPKEEKEEPKKEEPKKEEPKKEKPKKEEKDEKAPEVGTFSPLVRRLAREHDVDLSQVRGTGSGGRITRDDVMAFVEQKEKAPPSRDGDRGPARTAPPEVAAAAGERTTTESVTHIRKRIAEHMVESLRTSARAWNAVEVDMEEIARLRAKVGGQFRSREGFSLTYMPFIARACCEALSSHPLVNASLAPDFSEVTYHNYVNLGVAVATDYGLIVPVIKAAEGLNLVGLARAIRDLGERARDKKLDPDDVGGSTFSITNPGPFGSYMSLPVINQPNVAILSTEVVEKRVVVVDDLIGIRHRMFLSLSWDHRLLDGADAMRFLQRLKENLETWDFENEL